MAYAALSVLAALAARLPRSARVAFGVTIGWLFGSLVRVRRSLVESAMTRAKIDRPRAAASAMYRDLGLGVTELLWLFGVASGARDRAIRRVSIDEPSMVILDAALARGPVVLMASHTGNWELAAAAAAELLSGRGRKLMVVAKAMSERGVERFVSRLREKLGVRVIPPRGAFGVARRALAAGDVVVMPIDQVPDRAAHGLPVPFLGEMALADRAPATLAFRSRATALVVVAERRRGAHCLRVLDDILPPDVETSPRVWIDEATARATAALERFVRSSPGAWLWLHRRWRVPEFGRAAPCGQASGGLTASSWTTPSSSPIDVSKAA